MIEALYHFCVCTPRPRTTLNGMVYMVYTLHGAVRIASDSFSLAVRGSSHCVERANARTTTTMSEDIWFHFRSTAAGRDGRDHTARTHMHTNVRAYVRCSFGSRTWITLHKDRGGSASDRHAHTNARVRTCRRESMACNWCLTIEIDSL